jgi:cyclophilin family peptidyl-prolyl cis-trans isomerase
MPVEAMLAAAPDDEVRVRVLEVAGRNRTMPVAPLLESTRSASARVRTAAFYALARTRRSEGATAALQAMRDTVAAVREHAARLLVKPLVADSVAPFAITALGEWSRHPHPHVRIAALRSLASWGADVAEDLLQRLGTGKPEARDPDANVRVAVAQALDTGVVRSPAQWRAAWDADTTFMVRRSVLAGAMRAGVAVAGVADWRTDTDWRRRAAVAEAAGAAPESMYVPFGLPALQDLDGRVRTAAIGAVASRRDSSMAQRALLVRLARTESDLHGRATALGALVPRATHEDVPLALDVYRRAADDREGDARLAALRLLASAWRRDSANVDAPTRAAMAALPLPDDLLLRAAVKDVAPLAAWGRAPHPVRPIAHYRRIVRDYVEPARRGRASTMRIDTERGPVRIALACVDVPLTCAVFDSLAAGHFWDGARFHRVVPAFVAQDGDQRGDGNGGPGFAIRDELNRRRYLRGAVGMALSGPDTGGSQYFLTLSPQPHLDGRYTVIGTVVAGRAAMDALVQGDAIRTLRVVR